MMAGLGLGFTIAPSNNTGTFGVTPRDAGVAAATLNTGQQIGGSIGTSLLNTIFASAVAQYLTGHLSPATLVHGHPAQALAGLSLIHGYTTAFWVAAAIFGAGAVTCGTLFRSGPLRASGAAPAAPASCRPGGAGRPSRAGRAGRLTPPARPFSSSDRGGWAAAHRQPTPPVSSDNHPNVHTGPEEEPACWQLRAGTATSDRSCSSERSQR